MQFTHVAMDEKYRMALGLYQNFLGVRGHFLLYMQSDFEQPGRDFGEFAIRFVRDLTKTNGTES
jgi:hypothetical protein